MPSPFATPPHPLAKKAAKILQQHLDEKQRLPIDFSITGKMFGVLVVRNGQQQLGFLCAFSGMMNGVWEHAGFVPPLFDQEEQNSFLAQEKTAVATLQEELKALQNSANLQQLITQHETLLQQQAEALTLIKARHKAAKATRHLARIELEDRYDPFGASYQQEVKKLNLASQHDKREALQATQTWREKIHAVQKEIATIEHHIEKLKQLSQKKLRALHQRVYASYRLQNNLGERKIISDFFIDALPPAGAGDCAGAKLIHYAIAHQLQPLAMAEFWWGKSPKTTVRHHSYFYPACRGKCRPILPFMLRGLEIEAEPDYQQIIADDEPKTIFEDDSFLVINKPVGLLSNPGKHIKDSVFHRLLKRYPEHPELRLVHRLDMGTSGLLLVAKNLQINALLQRQFIQRTVEKRYEALLCKTLPEQPGQGTIDLPMRVDFYDKPRQMVCYDAGKPAQTHWEIIGYEGAFTRVNFYPHTGRTHQLRVHASHQDGLNAAIVGDSLYGLGAERMMLHAQQLCFNHPLTHQRMVFESPAPF
ncbi:MAG: RluA family pseudouridine synthase [Zetaproteobacteria bacterium]|nr:RluA family pseudouridine synthase [Zetaproteobacteria bacterium]